MAAKKAVTKETKPVEVWVTVEVWDGKPDYDSVFAHETEKLMHDYMEEGFIKDDVKVYYTGKLTHLAKPIIHVGPKIEFTEL